MQWFQVTLYEYAEWEEAVDDILLHFSSILIRAEKVLRHRAGVTDMRLAICTITLGELGPRSWA